MFLFSDIVITLSDIELFPNVEVNRINSLKGLKLFHHNIRDLWNTIDNITEFLTCFIKS